MWTRLRSWATRLKTDILALSLAGRDPRVAVAPKLIALAVAAYALSPIDLIPDFIPVLGFVDDLILVPLGIALAIHLVPEEIMRECRARATWVSKRASYGGGAMIVVVWVAVLVSVAAALIYDVF